MPSTTFKVLFVAKMSAAIFGVHIAITIAHIGHDHEPSTSHFLNLVEDWGRCAVFLLLINLMFVFKTLLSHGRRRYLHRRGIRPVYDSDEEEEEEDRVEAATNEAVAAADLEAAQPRLRTGSSIHSDCSDEKHDHQ